MTLRDRVREDPERSQAVVCEPLDQARVFEKVRDRRRAGVLDDEPIGKDLRE
jgi:hypothetical protein